MSDNDVSDVRPRWAYTHRARDAVRGSGYGPEGGPYGNYFGHHIIGRDSRIISGVYFVDGHLDEILWVLDDDNLKQVSWELDEAISRKKLQKIKHVLREVYEIVDRYLPYHKKRVEKLVANVSGGRTTKIPLATFVHERVGVCRHQALLAGYLIEKLIDEGTIKGTVSVDRNSKRDVWKEYWDSFLYNGWVGHAWARYTAPDGRVFIIDVAQRYCGRIENTPQYRGVWRDYFRPNDPTPVRDANVAKDDLEDEEESASPEIDFHRLAFKAVTGIVLAAIAAVILLVASNVELPSWPETGFVDPKTHEEPPTYTSTTRASPEPYNAAPTIRPRLPVTCGWYYDPSFGPQAVMLDGKYLLECSDGKVYRAGISSCARGACTHDNLTEVSRDSLKR